MNKPAPAPAAAARAPRSALARWWHWLTRDRAGPKLKAVPKAAPKETATPAELAQRQHWKDGLLAVGLVLDRHASARQVFRHLAALEDGISRHGPRALGRMPVEVLEQGLEQFEGLVRDWSVPALAFVRSAVSVEITARRRVRAAKDQELSVFVAPNKLHVDEDSESAFMEFQRHWAAANAEATGGSRPRRAA